MNRKMIQKSAVDEIEIKSRYNGDTIEIEAMKTPVAKQQTRNPLTAAAARVECQW